MPSCTAFGKGASRKVWALSQTPRLSAWPQPYLLGGKTQGLLFSVTISAASMGVGGGFCSGPRDFSWDTPCFCCCWTSQVLLLPVAYRYSDSRLLDALADLSEWLSSIVVFPGSGPQTRLALSSYLCWFLPIWSLPVFSRVWVVTGDGWELRKLTGSTCSELTVLQPPVCVLSYSLLGVPSEC
jgi:hypothetical protein